MGASKLGEKGRPRHCLVARLGWVHGRALAVQGESSALADTLHSSHTDELLRVESFARLVCRVSRARMRISIGGVTHIRLDSQWPASRGYHDHGA
jgi:hypothetical protein